MRLTNVFGPRQRLRDDLQGFLPIFVRRALADDAITVFGDGEQERDCLYVDDVVECLLLAATAPDAAGEIFNVGNDEHLSLGAIADAVVAAAGSGRVEHVPWPPDRDAIDIGSYFGDSSKAKRVLGWEPRTSFADGIARTVAFYRARAAVVPVTDGDPSSRASPSSTSPAGPRSLEPELSEAVDRVVRSGAYLFGPELEAFEREFAAFTGRAHAVGVASGTDALRLVARRAGDRCRATR